ncbi:MAG: sugar phosphate isomerase/epimerase family protein [Terrimicrobiaceae bacterium]
MKVGVFSAILSNLSLENALSHIAGLGCDTVELGTGAYPGDAHCKPAELLISKPKRDAFQKTVAASGLELSSLSCHGNPLHPDKKLAAAHHKIFENSVKLAAKIGVPVVTTFSGCPGDFAGAKFPNWVTCPWPPDFLEILNWQWEKVAIPYWKKQAAFAGSLGVKIAFEAHPGFLVYNPETLLKMRAACGPVIGANFDPSHFFWQGIDPVKAVRALAGAIHHVHAKDTGLYPVNADVNGYLDTKHYGDEKNRSWIFRTVGYGHGADFWCDFVSTLRLCGYDGTLSMEHEDSLMSPAEGLRKGVDFLKSVVIRDKKGDVTWA